MTLAPGSERDKPLEPRKLNRIMDVRVVRAQAIWQMSAEIHPRRPLRLHKMEVALEKNGLNF